MAESTASRPVIGHSHILGHNYSLPDNRLDRPRCILLGENSLPGGMGISDSGPTHLPVRGESQCPGNSIRVFIHGPELDPQMGIEDTAHNCDSSRWFLRKRVGSSGFLPGRIGLDANGEMGHGRLGSISLDNIELFLPNTATFL